MKVEAVVVCVDYSDFLAHTLLFNKNHFDKMVVVTSTKDKKTQKLCEYHYIQCIQTDSFYDSGADFNKANGINIGLKALDKSDFVVHMDADIALPPKTRSIFNAIDLDESHIYGIDRMMCNSFQQWARFVKDPTLVHETESYIHLKSFPVGTRLMKTEECGYVPIGFFQMWNPRASNVYVYPHEHTNAGRTDMLHAFQWPRRKRHLIPEIVGIHLSTPSGDMGANWRGRTTPEFSLEGAILLERAKLHRQNITYQE